MRTCCAPARRCSRLRIESLGREASLVGRPGFKLRWVAPRGRRVRLPLPSAIGQTVNVGRAKKFRAKSASNPTPKALAAIKLKHVTRRATAPDPLPRAPPRRRGQNLPARRCPAPAARCRTYRPRAGHQRSAGRGHQVLRRGGQARRQHHARAVAGPVAAAGAATKPWAASGSTPGSRGTRAQSMCTVTPAPRAIPAHGRPSRSPPVTSVMACTPGSAASSGPGC